MNDSDDGMLLPEPEPQPEPKPAPARPPATHRNADPSRTRATSRSQDADEDLSAEIVKRVPRERGEQVTCRRITKNHYRCNWWRAKDSAAYDNPSMGGLLVTTNRICKSQFLRATRAPDAPVGGAGSLCISIVAGG